MCAEWRLTLRIVRPVIVDSWERCRSKGVDPYLTRVPLVLGGEELQALLERNRELIDISRPFMEHLFGFVKGSNFIVALSDANGFLIELVGDYEILESVKHGNFVMGACWSEDVAGSNGVGTVLAMGSLSRFSAGALLHQFTQMDLLGSANS